MTLQSAPVPLSLPTDVRLEFFAEGAANIVYRIVLPSLSTTSHGPLIRIADSQPVTRPSTPPTEADLNSLLNGTSSTTPPPSDIDIPWLNEGIPSYALHDPYIHLRGRLLRLRKAVPWIPSYAELRRLQQELVFPLFPPGQLLDHQLIQLPDGLAAKLNNDLRTSEIGKRLGELRYTSGATHAALSTRAPKRHGVYIAADEPYGFLITDMTPDASTGELLIELKPKWLAQSPDAPKDARRCRTCALRAMRAKREQIFRRNVGVQALKDERGVQASKNSTSAFCPLDLASGEVEGVAMVVEALFSELHPDMKTKDIRQKRWLHDRLLDFLLKAPPLFRLKELQASLDPVGVLSLPVSSNCVLNDFLIAMTLRDCTLYIRMPKDESKAIEARIGDLDLKMAIDEKFAHWIGTEKALIDGDWYLRSDVEGLVGISCRLERKGLQSATTILVGH